MADGENVTGRLASRRSTHLWVLLLGVMVVMTACNFSEGDHYRDGGGGGNPGRVSLHPVASAEFAWIYNEHCNDDVDCFRNYINAKFLETGNIDERGRLVLDTIVAAPASNLHDTLDGWSVNTGDCLAVHTTEAGEFVVPQVYKHEPGMHLGPDCYPGGESTIPGWTYD